MEILRLGGGDGYGELFLCWWGCWGAEGKCRYMTYGVDIASYHVHHVIHATISHVHVYLLQESLVGAVSSLDLRTRGGGGDWEGGRGRMRGFEMAWGRGAGCFGGGWWEGGGGGGGGGGTGRARSTVT